MAFGIPFRPAANNNKQKAPVDGPIRWARAVAKPGVGHWPAERAPKCSRELAELNRDRSINTISSGGGKSAAANRPIMFSRPASASALLARQMLRRGSAPLQPRLLLRLPLFFGYRRTICELHRGLARETEAVAASAATAAAAGRPLMPWRHSSPEPDRWAANQRAIHCRGSRPERRAARNNLDGGA